MAEILRMYDIIDKKKRGEQLNREEISFAIRGLCDGTIPEYQITALLMAICFRGMTDTETYILTDEMLHSGRIVTLDSVAGIKVDKHSTGGVGDKTSLVLGPMVVSAKTDGVRLTMPKASGRGLGHTGGTLDKLESIPGFRVTLTEKELANAVNANGIAIVGQSGDLVPADKKLYALRDATCTVDSIPLIASSIMSKKLADGSDMQLLDVKYGNGAFMQTVDDARKLAQTMIAIGRKAGKNTRAEITSMEQPLGYEIGNINEVQEAVRTLKGEGPKDLLELCIHSGVTLLMMAGACKSEEIAEQRLRETITNGSAYRTFLAMVKSQGGDTSYIEDLDKFPKARYNVEIKSVAASGYLCAINTYDLGIQAMRLGAGRNTAEDTIDHTAGITLKKKIGDKVARGETIAVLHSERKVIDDVAREILADFTIREGEQPAVPPLIVETLQ